MARAAILLAFSFLPSCGDDDGGGADLHVGEACEAPEECFDTLAEEVPGEVICIDRVAGGYCSHACVDDTECCSVEGECDFGPDYGVLPEICAPLESMGGTWCFVSCEGVEDETTYCEGISPDLHCRSTGGGAENRKVCLPEA